MHQTWKRATHVFRLTVAIMMLTELFMSWSPLHAEDLQIRARTVLGEQVNVAPDGENQIHVICFLGAECPMARIYAPRLARLADEFRDRRVQFVGINSNRQDEYGDIRRFVDKLKIRFPFVQDKGNVIADHYGATRTPEVFVLDNQLQVRYHGRIDDQYEPGINRARAKREDLKIAIEEILSGSAVSVPETTAPGCIIGRVQRRTGAQIVDNDVTYTKHVVPVLQRHCLECHRSGEIGPFAMESYAEVAGWADTMMETIDNGRMPPWHASPEYGDFANARHMPDADKRVLRDWIAGGLKEGEASDLPPTRRFAADWQLPREPDQVIRMRDRPFEVPADGVVEYQYFVADPGFTEDKWIRAAQVVPGERSVVHHAIVFVRPPDGAEFRGVGWLSAYVPGQRTVELPPGCARFVPAGSKFVFQMHYTPNGESASDVTQIGLMFEEDDRVTHEAITLIGINQELEIPPNSASYEVEAEVPWLPEHAQLLAIAPHMHYRGKSFRLFASEDDSQVLLDVPRYDFNWQHSYVLTEPVPLRNLETLRFRVAFDNSGDNPFNPDPSRWVTWGDQTWEEMAVAFFEIAEPRVKPVDAARSDKVDKDDGAISQERIDAYVARALEKLDANRDGRILKNEVPTVVRHFSFERFDLNGDGAATKDELRKIARRIYSPRSAD